MIRLIIVVVIGVLALSYLGITIESIVNSPAGQANFGYLGNLLVWIWHLISGLVTYLESLLEHAVS